MIAAYYLVLFVLSIYSFTQIDLNLTLFQNSVFLYFQQLVVSLGYYNRPLSSIIYFALILILVIFNIYFLRLARVGKLNLSKVILLVVPLIILGFISYPAFSYDFFNYLFDARIITKYGQNPWLFKPLDFPADQWLRFMHWVHRTYPYGPTWLFLTAPFSYFGFEKLVLTMLNFKIMFIGFYVGSLVMIYKILNKVDSKNKLYGLLYYGLNPLVIIESIVSPHIDSAMTFFMLLGFYVLIKEKKGLSFIALLFSGGIKFITLILLPIPFIKKSWQTILDMSFILSFLVLLPVIWQRELNPWYFLPIISLAALMKDRFFLKGLTLSVSFGLLLRYLPFIYVGSYPTEVQLAKNIIVFIPIVIFIVLFYVQKSTNHTKS